eukprot:CAMPEP_0179438300 /NCGR_PEP_ID=MMETSP0799-20121207/22058_1 /TAXON_ID=46947 /ORGANISM="Geminigera cryophila, Strain CCMP2564" /LENGTH=369 /DNA_ID=CAMNT_0021219829 /DNA_START=245 /DNA_END=1356 /DNA_ORIENTATION=-
MAAEKAKRFSQSKKEHARSASHGAFFCWALLKGGVLCCLFVLPGDLTISLQSGSPVYGGVYLSFYFTAVLLYLRLIKSDPGFLTSEEHHSLLEDGEMRRRSKDSDSSHGIEMRARAASLGMAGPPKVEPDLTASVAAALDKKHQASADENAHSDSEDIQAAEEFVDKLAARLSSRGGRGPAQADNAAAAQGAMEEGAPVKRRATDGLDEITLCVEGEVAGGGYGMEGATGRAPTAPPHVNTAAQNSCCARSTAMIVADVSPHSTITAFGLAIVSANKITVFSGGICFVRPSQSVGDAAIVLYLSVHGRSEFLVAVVYAQYPLAHMPSDVPWISRDVGGSFVFSHVPHLHRTDHMGGDTTPANQLHAGSA